MTANQGTNVSRRTALRVGVSLAVAATVAPLPTGIAEAQQQPGPAGPDRLAQVRTGAVSTNGWPIEKNADIGGAVWTREIDGTGLSVALSIGEVQTVLGHVVRRYCYEIDVVQPGEVVGHIPVEQLPPSTSDNHASGTAVDIRPGWYPAGTRGNFFPSQLNSVHTILAECHGVVAWGGYRTVADEGHFEIAVPPRDPRLVDLAAELREWKY
ncbi:M15 family peptidase [Amycolatopsis balhimycina DSM 5908]|uniref:M15 family peptidase n=1 Tax=Amycolatopsis balhimycina DSM 5908 TaxID=1081091 RepID=A0A428W4M4_AMYBA|nr:M15 family metallopeptidase [Amycolatopsis balhimycina]RSM37924.1 M15 family peptidase [Amycolatopsis balhimycina DSM 5908]